MRRGEMIVDGKINPNWTQIHRARGIGREDGWMMQLGAQCGLISP
jgi:hypothetical protein